MILKDLWQPLQLIIDEAIYKAKVFGLDIAVYHSSECQHLHEYGIAADFILKSPTLKDWQVAGEVFESFGFTWGGRWENVIFANHIQWDLGIGNRPKSFKSITKEGGFTYLHQRLVTPMGTEQGEIVYDVDIRGNEAKGILVQGSLLIPTRMIKEKVNEENVLRFGGDLFIDADKLGKIHIATWPEIVIL